LSGIYLGTIVNVTYTWTDPTDWTDTGTYGLLGWTGSGSSTIADTSSTTFQVTFNDTLTVGGDNLTLNYIIPGTVLGDGTIMYGDATDPEAGTGTQTGNVAATLKCFSYLDAAMTIKSDVFIVIDPSKPNCSDYIDPNEENKYLKKAGTTFSPESGTIQTEPIPEPATLLMLSSGLLTLILVAVARNQSRGIRK
jgi:hypothetical protein